MLVSGGDEPLHALWLAGFASLMLGGLVKGILGVGLPLVVIPLLSLFIPTPQAMGLLVMPVLISNLLQTIVYTDAKNVFSRFKWVLVWQLLATVGAVHFTRNLSWHGLNVVLAVVVMSAVVTMALGASFSVSQASERWMGPVVGCVAGAMAGASSLTGPILITYLLALGLGREAFIGTISIIYLCGAVPMYAAMLWYGRFGLGEVGLSCLALVPMTLGLHMGQKMRHHLSDRVFRQLLLGFLSVLSILLVLK